VPRALIAVVAAVSLIAAACGGDDDDGTAQDDGDTTASTETGGGGELTDSFRGVTADAIRIGIVLVDYDAIAFAVDFNRGDQEQIARTFVDAINAEGGVGGRRLEPVFVEYPPIPGQEPSPLAVCTQLTEDEEVFAVLGVFIDFTGEGQLCLARDHQTVHIGHELEQRWIDEAPPGLLITPDTTKEGRASVLLEVLAEEGTLEGRTVAVVGDQDTEQRVNDLIVPGLEDMGVETGSTAILSIAGEDTSAAQSQLDGFIERWKDEDVDTVFLAGNLVSAKQFVEKIEQEMPDVLLVTDNAAVLGEAQDLTAAGADPNPYAGMLTAEGMTRSERWRDPSPALARCIDVYEEATGEEIVPPDEVTPGPDGKKAEIAVAVEDFCGELQMFKQIAEKAGANLTNESWVDAVNGFGEIELPTTPQASLCEGKYAAADDARLVEFDPTIGETGDWKPLGEVIDASGGRCT
jgi:ABC-type branched-subunit amino acid transport system substrate-binding protein